MELRRCGGAEGWYAVTRPASNACRAGSYYTEVARPRIRVCAAFTFGKSSVEHNFQLHHTPPPPRRPLFVGCSSDPYSRPHFHCGALHPARLPSTRRPTTSQECASASIVLMVTTLIRAKTASLLEGRDPHTENYPENSHNSASLCGDGKRPPLPMLRKLPKARPKALTSSVAYNTVAFSRI